MNRRGSTWPKAFCWAASAICCPPSKASTNSSCISSPARPGHSRARWTNCERRSGGLEASGETSRLGAGLRHVLGDLRGTPPAAILLLTDGINTDGESLADAARYARRKGVPLFTVGLGSEQPVRDLELADLLVDEVVFVDDVVNFECKLERHRAGRPQCRASRFASRASPTCWPHTKVTVGADGAPQRVRLPYRPTQVGEFEYVVEVEHLADESRTDNNRGQRLVSVRKEQIRVLLGPGLSELRVPLSQEHARSRQHDPAQNRAARRRPGVRRARSLGAARLSGAPRRAVRVRRVDLRRRESRHS